MNFVDDIDLVARRNRRITNCLDDFANIVNARMAGRVHLDHVDMPALGNRHTGLTHSARVDRRPALPVRADTIERLGDQPRGRGFAHPAHPGHQEGMRQPLAPDGVGQRLHHRILADQLAKRLRPIFARQHAIGLRDRSGSRAHRRQIEPQPQRILRHGRIALTDRLWLIAKHFGGITHSLLT